MGGRTTTRRTRNEIADSRALSGDAGLTWDRFMHRVNFDEEQLPLRSPGKSDRFLLRTPRQVTEDAALLINLAMDRRRTLDDHPYCIASNLFLAAGHRAASFDLPNHGDNADDFGSGLDGIAAAIAAGVDAFEVVRASTRSMVDHAIRNGLVRPGRIFVSGTSRGGLSALHAMAAEPRIAAAAVFAPVTDLEVLQEFAPLASSALLQRSNARALIDQLAGRPVFVSIGMSDARVGTSNCLELFARLQFVCPQAVLHVDPSAGHANADATRVLGTMYLLDLAARSTLAPSQCDPPPQRRDWA